MEVGHNLYGYGYDAVDAYIRKLIAEGKPRIQAVAIAYAQARLTFFKRHPRGAIPAWLSFPHGYRLREHYDKWGRPLHGSTQQAQEFQENPASYSFPYEVYDTYQQIHVAGYVTKRQAETVAFRMNRKAQRKRYIVRLTQHDDTRAFQENPAPRSDVARATKLFKDFTGRAPDGVRKLKLPPQPRAGVVFGQLVRVGYRSARDGLLYEHTFRTNKSRPLLIASSDGNQVLIFGGRYAFTDRGIVDK